MDEESHLTRKRLPNTVPTVSKMSRSNEEYYQMFVTFAQCNGNASVAAARYRELHPGGYTPYPAAFRRLANRLCSRGTWLPARRRNTLRSNVVFEDFDWDEWWLDEDEDENEHDDEDNDVVGRDVGVRMQMLRPEDYVQRMKFSKWLLEEIERSPSFCRFVLWTDEALFIPEGCIDPHTAVVLDDEIPNAIYPRAVQEPWSVYLWAGICDEFIVGPYVLQDRLNGRTYHNFLKHVLPGLLEDIPLQIRKNMYFQHSDAPAHYVPNVRAYLDQAFHDRWIGRGGTVQWPPQSPEMNPLHFYFWEHLKNAVYR